VRDLSIAVFGLPVLLQEKGGPNVGIYTVKRSQTHEFGNWVRGAQFLFWEDTNRNFFAVRPGSRGGSLALHPSLAPPVMCVVASFTAAAVVAPIECAPGELPFAVGGGGFLQAGYFLHSSSAPSLRRYVH
jgi:hypothetical protein